MSDPLSLSNLEMFNLPGDVYNRESGLLTQREQEEVAKCPILLSWNYKILQLGNKFDNENYKAGNFRCFDRWLVIGRRRTGKKCFLQSQVEPKFKYFLHLNTFQGRLCRFQGAGHCLPLFCHLRPLPPWRQLRCWLGLQQLHLHDDTLAHVPWARLWKELQSSISPGETQESFVYFTFTKTHFRIFI